MSMSEPTPKVHNPIPGVMYHEDGCELVIDLAQVYEATGLTEQDSNQGIVMGSTMFAWKDSHPDHPIGKLTVYFLRGGTNA